MPNHTDAKIRELCTQAIAATTAEDAERVLSELRAALEEHIRLAKDSLLNQMDGMVAMAAIAKKAAIEVK